MANDNEQPTWGERMEAMRMNLELMGHQIEDSRREFREQLDATHNEFREQLNATHIEFTDRSRILMTAVEQLVIATGALTNRVERIERRIA